MTIMDATPSDVVGGIRQIYSPEQAKLRFNGFSGDGLILIAPVI